MTSKKLDEAAQIIEDMCQGDIRKLGEFCVDHMDDVKEVEKLKEYLLDHLAIELGA